ncbi:molybdopterin-guanine dinucleotide biosynthesis protein B [Gracilibacillus oryzae]|uniref:molybdopterin-guanine dinucleotide biosynthesis protein B n=1 Tax=Gracilibacillus oryzae TaxID=1672701 RepID=UPI001885D06F|nr:molybdopterin-guanine dinucleotide biosynthesis protein B [Gracilibacillus oryzae]
MYVIQIVGYKNSGKTTVVTELVRRLQGDGYNVATLKHHGHGGEPDYAANTDTAKHWMAGAAATTVFGEKTLQLQIENQNITVERILSLYEELKIDITIMEGFKQLNFGKIVLIRNQDDIHLLKDLTNIKMVYSQDLRIDETNKPLYRKKENLLDDVQKQFITFGNLH